jgi:hypothetical protein
MTHVTWRGTWNGRAPNGLDHQRARTIVRPTGGILRGKFPSRKTGRMVQHEGMLELDAIYHFETSPLIAQYTEQPLSIHYADGAQLRRYTPDFELHLVSGETILVEIKPKKYADGADTRHTLERVQEHFDRCDQPFVVLTDQVIRKDPRRSNLRKIYHLAPRIRPTFLKCSVELKGLSSLFPLHLREAIGPLSRVGLDPYSLLMVGLLTCDLGSPINDGSVLNICQEDDHAWFRLSDRFGF